MMRHRHTPTTFGLECRRRDYPGMTLIESAYRPALRIAPHAHELPVCVLVLQGTVTTTSMRGTLTGGPRSARTVLPREMHSNRYGADGARCMLLEVKPELKHRVGDHIAVLETPLPRASADRAADILRRMYDEFIIDDDVAALAVESCLLELVALLARSGHSRSRSPAWLEPVMEILRTEFRRSITVQELSELAHVHPVYFARQFRQHYGSSPSDYIRSLRVQWARHELRRSDAPLSLIAADAGFADQSHFTRAFRRIVGTTPARYRAWTQS